jgi:hypothetical protein
MLAAASVAADGPAGQVVGVTITADTDGGSGEQWGRAGGRTVTYTVGDISAFATLNWGNQNGTAPSVAFDDDLDASEVLTSHQSGAVGCCERA